LPAFVPHPLLPVLLDPHKNDNKAQAKDSFFEIYRDRRQCVALRPRSTDALAGGNSMEPSNPFACIGECRLLVVELRFGVDARQ
jgi:hypothetical protein